VLTPDQCAQVWAKAVPSGDFLTEANAAPYIVNFKQADGPDQDGKIFQERVQSGVRQRAREVHGPLVRTGKKLRGADQSRRPMLDNEALQLPIYR
jgi:hypothetical protein